MTIAITLFKIHLQIIYFFIKLFTRIDNKKIVFLSRQGDKMSIDFELLRDDIKKKVNTKLEKIIFYNLGYFNFYYM